MAMLILYAIRSPVRALRSIVISPSKILPPSSGSTGSRLNTDSSRLIPALSSIHAQPVSRAVSDAA